MNEADIRKYAALMKELELTGLEITEENRMVRLERTQSTPFRELGSIQAAAAPASLPISDAEPTSDQLVIRSPLVGVFYAAPAENASPFVSIGDRVKKGQPLCIIEAMKLMNEITAEEDGVIDRICVTNGQVVEYGTELFRIRR